MNDFELVIGYFLWFIIAVLTIVLFNYFSTKYKSLLPLVAIVLPISWIGSAIIWGIINLVVNNSNELFSLRGISMLMAEIFASFIVIGGITFFVKFIKMKKKMNKI